MCDSDDRWKPSHLNLVKGLHPLFPECRDAFGCDLVREQRAYRRRDGEEGMIPIQHLDGLLDSAGMLPSISTLLLVVGPIPAGLTAV
jgi:hypothetical protein